jgi:hypothetical protein
MAKSTISESIQDETRHEYSLRARIASQAVRLNAGLPIALFELTFLI